MEDEELTRLNNLCADLVSEKRWEAFPVHLLVGKRPAEWVRVRDLCLQAKLEPGELDLNPVATWLPDPAGDEGYALIVFYDEESMWTLAARYNRQRLLAGVLPGLEGQAEHISGVA